MNRSSVGAAAAAVAALALLWTPYLARAQGDMEGTPDPTSIPPRRHAYHRSPVTRGNVFEVIRAQTDTESVRSIDTGGPVLLRQPNASWTYVYPFNSPYYWDASRSYDWTYYWWRAGKARHPSRKGLSANDG